MDEKTYVCGPCKIEFLTLICEGMRKPACPNCGRIRGVTETEEVDDD